MQATWHSSLAVGLGLLSAHRSSGSRARPGVHVKEGAYHCCADTRGRTAPAPAPGPNFALLPDRVPPHSEGAGSDMYPATSQHSAEPSSGERGVQILCRVLDICSPECHVYTRPMALSPATLYRSSSLAARMALNSVGGTIGP